MQYPNFSTVTKAQNMEEGKETEQLFEMIASCMFQVWEGEETYDTMDYTAKDKREFLESLDHQQFEKLQEFFETMPTLKHEVEVTNPKTNVTSMVTLSGINAFF
jgi:ribosome-associated toxin RatA of RatAB toxin-antitoxin module